LRKLPTRILFSAEKFKPYVSNKLDVMNSFIQDFEKVVEIVCTSVDIDELWKTHAPSEVAPKTLDDFLGTVRSFH